MSDRVCQLSEDVISAVESLHDVIIAIRDGIKLK